ncbi:hypothetical protein ANCDUO_12126 [Ancylostoma duodenale]|uniref:Uncharacterized protein n=1 Tax=Ancylostoma duodenale TaxID=51022 RepID=A0A0C2GFI5_9BILA|nr:hypothetical protein ANCDUO_12126 [Ancylostoma duodenale]
MRKPLLLLTVINEDSCLINSTIREFFYKYHTDLRRRVALGQEYQGKKFQEQEMYGLIYDCKLERAARRKAIQTMGGTLYVPEGVVWIDFTGDYRENNLLAALQIGLDEQVKDEESSRKATTEKGSMVERSDEREIPGAKREALL